VHAERLAESLEEQGWSVWWDRLIPPGKTFDEVIDEALRASRCVIVIWSNASVTSRWVAAEAEEALRRGALLPILVEPSVRVPLQFRAIQAADLTNWSGVPTDPHFQSVVEAVQRLVGAPPQLLSLKLNQKPDVVLEVGDIFLSYSREDDAYAKKLLDLLRKHKLSVWADDRIDYGDRWWKTIVANIRSCVAMVVIMTPRSEESKWVEREILFADDEKKPIFPLLLEGKRFPLLIGVQYHDVTNGKMPPLTFVATLKKLAARKDAV